MKRIKEMSLQELADEMNVYTNIFPHIGLVVDRIHELHELTRWIPVEERMPTGADANERGLVCTYKDGRTGLCFLGENGRPRVWHNAMHEYVCFDNQFTHWRRIDTP